MATVKDEEVPQSVEEAGALLGATITFYGTSHNYKTTSPPKGTHSSFATISPIPSSELFVRLHTLRALLRSAPTDTPLVAAPSLLAGVLIKLLGVSNKLASATNADATRRVPIPPMLSTPLRKLWVDCVVLCHSLGEGLSGNARINIYGFLRNMISLASLNPRTAKAAGGTRVAALEAIEGIMKDPKLSVQLASWAFDVTHLCQRALKSSGNGEPTFRIAAVRTACSVVIASRDAFMKTRPVEGTARLVLKGALDDKAIFEMVKLLKTAVNDKFVEVRTSAARLASLLAPLVIHIAIKSPRTPDAAVSATASLEDIMTLAFKNLDDESAECAAAWAEALARCMSTAIEVGAQLSAEQTSQRDVEGGGAVPSPSKGSGRGSRNTTRKGVLPASTCSTLPKALKYLVSAFVKAGGELVAQRTGGTFSKGGRAVRLGFAKTVIQLFRLQSEMQSIGEGKAISHKEAILIILSMVGTDIELQLKGNEKVVSFVESLDATSVVTAATVREPPLSDAGVGQQTSGNVLFGQAPKVSHADASMVRLCTSRVLREGILNLAPETTQLALLHEFIELCAKRRGELKGNQLQVLLTEISHLVARLGEAAHSCLEELTPALTVCLRHPDHGVRYESAVVCAAIASIFPSEGRRLVDNAIRDIQLEHAELMAIASSSDSGKSDDTFGTGRFRFGRRPAQSKTKKPDHSMDHQYAIHGMSLMVTMIVQQLPHLPGGLPIELLDDVMSSAEFLCSTYFNDILTRGNPSGVCTSVRAGFAMIAGVLGTGPNAITKHVERIFTAWQKLSKLPSRGDRFTSDHEMICVEALLTSVLVFLQNCSELLLSVPDALSQVSLVLEQLLPLFNIDGRLAKAPENPVAASRLDSAKACIMEAFTWLPPGSYPMVADALFGFAARHIQIAVENGVPCSVLSSISSREDKLLDSTSFSRAKYPGQAGGIEDLENEIIARKAEAAHHSDRESVLYFLPGRCTKLCHEESEFLESRVLGMFIHGTEKERPPTALHGVGTWQRPAAPSCSAKIRLVDASVQAFAATFTLKGPKEQHNAIKMLESMVPPLHFQSPKGMGAAFADKDRRGKDYSASFTNVTAVLVSCLRALPVQESTHNVTVGIGPSWMTQAKDILLNVLPSRSPFVRRAAAEGLAVLSTIGVKEDAQFLQSAVLHSLDEVFQGTYGAGQVRPTPVAADSSASATALLTLGCIQRTSHRIRAIRADHSRSRGSSQKNSKDDSNDILPTVQMMIRILPSTNCGMPGAYFGVRASALHAFGLLVAYSNKLREASLGPNELQLLKKVAGIVEDNFLAAWTTASADKDQGNEDEKLALEPCFLAVLLRLMTFLVPSLHHLQASDRDIASRFSRMTSVIVECNGRHPAVSLEALAFYELLTKYQDLLPPHSGGLKYDENPLLNCIPFLITNLTPDRAIVHPQGDWNRPIGSLSCAHILHATLTVIKELSRSRILVAEWSDLKIVSLLFAALEDSTGSRCFAGETKHRGISAPRETELAMFSESNTEPGILSVVRLLARLELGPSKDSGSFLLRMILLARAVVVGSSDTIDGEDGGEGGGAYTVQQVTWASVQRASLDAEPVFNTASPVRWQVKIAVVQMATIALHALSRRSNEIDDSSSFNPNVAKTQCLEECRKANANKSPMPQSRLALHIEILVSMACVAATSTVDQTELRMLQECAMPLLSKIIKCFGPIPDPDQPGTSVLHDHIPQISSCIKSALAAPDENEEAASCRLFMAGCEVLRSFLRAQLSTEIGVLKRVIRPALPSSDDVLPFDFAASTPTPGGEPSKGKTLNLRSSLLLKIGKLWTIGNIPIDNPDIMSMLKPDKEELGIHSALLAIDGARLLLASNLSLCGSAIAAPNNEISCISGFLYRHLDDIDDFVKGSLAEKWAACASNAVSLLSDSIESETQKQAEIETLLKKVVRLMFLGLRDAIALRDGETSKHGTPVWASSVDSIEITSNCLKGMGELLAKPCILALEDQWIEEVGFATTQISEYFLLPALSIDRNGSSLVEVEIVEMSCIFLKSMTSNPNLEVTNDLSFLLSLLRPLECLETKSVDLNDKQAAMIISTCLLSIAKIICKSTTPKELVQAMLSLAFATCGKEIPQMVANASQVLLNECLKHDSITLKEQSILACKMATARNFSNWSVIVQASEGVAAKQSLDIIRGVLVDSAQSDQQVEAVVAIREVLQKNHTPSRLIGRVFCSVGAEILAAFQMYGTLAVPKESHPKRTTVCADCMKIVLSALQQLASDDAMSDEDIASFLVATFLAFIPVVRFNGLPNHPPPQGQLSDPDVGRLCAQAMVHVARITPAPFKTSVTLMPEQDRAVLEFSVRAEMSGYANAAAQAPVKKKLNLKSFKK